MKKLIAFFLLVLAVVFTASCNSTLGGSKYPTKYQKVTNPDQVITTVNGVNVTKNDVFYSLLALEGAQTVGEMVDNNLLPALTAEEKEVAKALFVEKNGEEAEYDAEANELAYRRYLAAKADFIANIDVEDEEGDGKVYNTKAYKSFFESNYTHHYVAQVAFFYSEHEALTYLETAGVTKDEVGAFEWNCANVEEVFTNIGAAEFTQETLAKVVNASAVTTKVASLKAGEYTHAPIAFGDKFFLARCVSVSEEYYDAKGNVLVDKDGSHVTEFDEETAKDTFFNLMASKNFGDFLSSTASSNVNQYLFKNRQEKGLKIYYEGLEISYKKAYDQAFASTTDEDEFAVTKDESETCFFECNGVKYTADQVFEKLNAHNTPYVAATYLITSVIDNIAGIKVENGKFAAGAKADYEKVYNAKLADIKKSFKANGFASQGFKRDYGFDNFLRDYYGATSEVNYICLYSDIFDTTVADMATKNKAPKVIADVSEITVEYDSDVSAFIIKCDKWEDFSHSTDNAHKVTKTTLNSTGVRPSDLYEVDTTVMPKVSLDSSKSGIILTFTYNYKGSDDAKKDKPVTKAYTTSYTVSQYYTDEAKKLYEAYKTERDEKKLDSQALVEKYNFAQYTPEVGSIVVEYADSVWTINCPEWDLARANSLYFGTSLTKATVKLSDFSSKLDGATVKTDVAPTVSIEEDKTITLTFATTKGGEDSTYTYKTTYKADRATSIKKNAIDNKLVGDKFTVALTGVTAYFDADLDGVKDEELTQEQLTMLQNVVASIWARVDELYVAGKPGSLNGDGKNLAVCIDVAIREFNNSVDTLALSAKRNGIVIVKSNSVAYNQDSEVDENLVKTLRDEWSLTVTNVNGSNLDPVYRVTSTTNSVTTVYTYTSKMLDAVVSAEDNCVYQFAIVKFSSASDSTSSSTFVSDALAKDLASEDSIINSIYDKILATEGLSQDVVDYFEELKK